MIQDIYPHQFSNKYIAGSQINENDYIFHFKGISLLLKQNKQGFEFPRKKDLKQCDSEGIFLFSLNDTRCFLIWDCQAIDHTDLAYHEANSLTTKSQAEIDWCSAVALHLKNWYEQHKYCGKCGSRNQLSNTERAIECTSCQHILYPNISPAIIVAIISDDKILLARGANWTNGMFSLVAGYVDIGETIENAVKREVKEEVGVDIKNIRYYKSQPWPFSGSMMIGFIAEADSKQTINIDQHEIAEAAWYTRDNLPTIPPQRSIAGEIIKKFAHKEL
ncbi:NAD(+) diphosphatase [Labilibacter sediminis]|nr:NAD(+) diphosphatase [Labilibacter sediminis]